MPKQKLSLRTSEHTGVAIRFLAFPWGKVSRASPASARRMRAKAPLADQGELSRASPASTRLRGSEPKILAIPQSKIKDFCQLPLHKGAVGAPAPVRLSMLLRKTGNCTTFVFLRWHTAARRNTGAPRREPQKCEIPSASTFSSCPGRRARSRWCRQCLPEAAAQSREQ